MNIIVWYSRKILSGRQSTSIDALDEAIYHFGCPEIFNSDKGSQFTSQDFTKALKDNSIKICLDGRGAKRDDVFIASLRRSVKYEHVYLNCYQSI